MQKRFFQNGIFVLPIFLVINLLAVEVFVVVSAAGQTADGYVRQSGFDFLHYNLRLSLSDTNNVIHGKALLTVHRRDTQDTTLALDLKNMAITAAWVGSKAARYQTGIEQVEVDLPRGIDTLIVAIEYRGEPKDGLDIKQNKFKRRTIFADNWPDRARNWFPGLDHPNDKATVEFHITAPERYTVVANGQLEREQHNLNGTKTWSWRERAPIPTYCMVFGAAEFAVLHLGETLNTPINYYVFPGDAPVAEKSFGRTAQMLQFFSNNIGAYPYEKLALVQSSTRFGGMENSSAIFFAESLLGSPHAEGTTAHEIAHQWFGDSVTAADWHHLWLSEGFATYFAALFYEHIDGEAAFHERMRSNRASYLEFSRKKATPILDTTVTRYLDLLNANNYPKAAWVLHMLRQQVGTENFWKGIREYYRVYKNGNALTDDFRQIMERVSGEKLDWFFNQWLRQPGHPLIKYNWRWLSKEKVIGLTLQQTQPGRFFRLPLEIEIVGGGEKLRQKIWMEKAEAEIRLPQNKMPEQINLDPDEKVLMMIVK
jgi:aminopeptidase N